MLFLADMGVSLKVVEWLRVMGHETVHLRDQDLQRMPNGDIFRKAAAEQRIVLTFDLDFGEIAAHSREDSPGVVLFRLHNTRATHVIDRLRVVLADCAQELAGGAIVLVEESRLRIRRLPRPPLGP